MASLANEQERARGIPNARPVGRDADRGDDAEERRFSLPPGYELQPLPGSELPATVYRLIVFAYIWLLGAAWYAFGRDGGTDLLLGMASVLAIVFLGIPMAMRTTAAPRLPRPEQPRREIANCLGARRDGDRIAACLAGVDRGPFDPRCSGDRRDAYWRSLFGGRDSCRHVSNGRLAYMLGNERLAQGTVRR